MLETHPASKLYGWWTFAMPVFKLQRRALHSPENRASASFKLSSERDACEGVVVRASAQISNQNVCLGGPLAGVQGKKKKTTKTKQAWQAACLLSLPLSQYLYDGPLWSGCCRCQYTFADTSVQQQHHCCLRSPSAPANPPAKLLWHWKCPTSYPCYGDCCWEWRQAGEGKGERGCFNNAANDWRY